MSSQFQPDSSEFSVCETYRADGFHGKGKAMHDAELYQACVGYNPALARCGTRQRLVTESVSELVSPGSSST